MPRLGERFHALRQADRVSLRRVVHAQIVADLADHHLARVEAHATRERRRRAGRAPRRRSAQLVAQMQRRVAGALRVVLVRDRRAEQRHDAVAGELVDRALEAMHAVGEDREEAIEDLVPLFGIELLGELHRALHVGEQHGDLLAFAFEGGLARCRIFSARCSGCRSGGARGVDAAHGRVARQRSSLKGSAAPAAEAWSGGLACRKRDSVSRAARRTLRRIGCRAGCRARRRRSSRGDLSGEARRVSRRAHLRKQPVRLGELARGSRGVTCQTV